MKTLSASLKKAKLQATLNLIEKAKKFAHLHITADRSGTWTAWSQSVEDQYFNEFLDAVEHHDDLTAQL